MSGSGPSLVYHPATNYFGPDAFTFRVDDGQGNTAEALVSIIVAQVTDVGFARLELLGFTQNQLGLALSGEPNERYRIEASQDLVHWVVLTNLVPIAGPMPFLDPEAALYPRRFYRSVLQMTPPRLSAPDFAEGRFQLGFATDIGRNYRVLASSNLVHWTILTNLTASASNTVVLDPEAGLRPLGFYRVMVAP